MALVVPATSRARRALLLCGVSILAGCAAPLAATRTSSGGSSPAGAWTTPTKPPNCTAAQLTSGNVVDCLVASGSPAAGGFGTPPFPPAAPSAVNGWVWRGGDYNGSPALASWEAGRQRNATAAGAVRPGVLFAPPVVLQLFSGLLADLHAGGYPVREAYTYAFRCTSNSAQRDCVGLTPASLSMHAWGLALDINWSTNPERTYRAAGATSACAVPMVTDLPRWAIFAAQRWGLFWGGYGWSNRCPSPLTWAETVNRDTHHVEFRGSVALAQAIIAWNATHPAPAQARP